MDKVTKIFLYGTLSYAWTFVLALIIIILLPLNDWVKIAVISFIMTLILVEKQFCIFGEQYR